MTQVALRGVTPPAGRKEQVHGSSLAELVGGNCTNVTSDLGAWIAAGGTLQLLEVHRRHGEEIQRLHRLVREQHAELPRGG